MVFRQPERSLFDFCAERNIGFVAYSPYPLLFLRQE
ncbi:hypothetical protein [Neisseria sp. HMSC31F04]